MNAKFVDFAQRKNCQNLLPKTCHITARILKVGIKMRPRVAGAKQTLDKFRQNMTKRKEKVMKRDELKLKLTKDEELETWIKTLLTVYPTIPNIEKVISSIIESKACNLSACYTCNGQAKYTSYEQVNRILEIIERKDRLIEVYHLIRDLIKPISKEDMKFVEMRFFHRMKPEKIATLTGVSLRTIYRHTNRIIERIAESCMDRGITSRFLESKTKGEPWIHAQAEKCRAEKMTNYKRGRNEFASLKMPENNEEVLEA